MSKKMRHPASTILIVILSAIVLIALLFSGYLGTTIYGIYYLMDNTGTKYNLEITRDVNSYSVQIDLDHPENNTGRMLYQQNGAKILIEKVYKKSIPTTGEAEQYIVRFQSVPIYSPSSGLFVSFYARNYGNSGLVQLPLTEGHAKCSISYNGKNYDSLFVTSDSGDQLVGCGLFNHQAIQDGALRNAHGTITFHVSHLLIYNWTKKVEGQY